MEILLTVVFVIMTNNPIILIHQNTPEKGHRGMKYYNYEEQMEASGITKERA